MEAKDLRIGNLIFNGRVTGLKEDEIIFHDGYQVWSSKDMISGTIKPIPITEEWLKKLGFEEREDSEGWFKNGILFYDGFLCNEQVDPLKYIHQLQNLFFSLTGKDL